MSFCEPRSCKRVTKHKHISEETFKKIDIEIRQIIDNNYVVAEKILQENIDILHTMAKALIEFETIDKDQIDDLMERKPMREAAAIIDSDVTSTELGKGVVDVSKDIDDCSNKKPLSVGDKEQIA